MPTTKVIKPKPVEATRRAAGRSSPAAGRAAAAPGAAGALRVPAVRKSRASSCPRCPQRGRSVAAAAAAAAAPGPGGGGGGTRRARSTSAAPLRAAATEPPRHPREQRRSHKAFTVIPPNPKKRREIQKKAEAELAALEELRLSRALAYVSINPSSVGGCLSLEEVRLKQQQEMMLAKRKPKQIKKQVMEETPVMTI